MDQDQLNNNLEAENDYENNLAELLIHSEKPELDDEALVLDNSVLNIDINEINSEARKTADDITRKLSNYYFDEKYIENHPYIPNKIMQEMNNIRRLLKMLSINEAAQDALISNITFNAGKGSLYASLTALQNSMLNIQTQLNRLTESLENIFKQMQAECEKTFDEKDKDDVMEDGSMIVRGSREFIKSLNNRLYGTDVSQNEPVQLDLFTDAPEDNTQENNEETNEINAETLFDD